MGFLFGRKKNTTVMPDMEGLHYEVANLQGLGRRKYQEDSFCVANVFDEKKQKEQGLLFAVCDGMGGLSNGQDVSNLAAEIIRKRFTELDRKSDISEGLRRILTECSDEIYKKHHEESGSTGIMGVILDGSLYFASVGDSLLYLLRQGVSVRLNELHNHGNAILKKCVEEDNWNPFLARNDVQKNALTSFLGTESVILMDSTYKPIELMPGDVLLACSDGVGSCFDEDELKDILIATDAVKSTRKIEQKVLQENNPNQDNYTAIVICVR